MSLSDDIQKLFTQQLDPEMRKLLLQRTKEMTQSQDLSNFKQCQIGDKIVPVCMYDVLRRLPLTSADPIFQIGEYFSMLLTIKLNYTKVMGTQTAANMQLVRRFDEHIEQIMKEVSTRVLGKDL